MRTDVTRNRPTVKTRTTNHKRCTERRRILRQLGVTVSEDIQIIARCAARFAAKVQELGRDPASYGTLGVTLVGGWPRDPSPAARARTERYHILRKHGWDSIDSNKGAKTVHTFKYAMRRIALGLGYR